MTRTEKLRNLGVEETAEALNKWYVQHIIVFAVLSLCYVVVMAILEFSTDVFGTVGFLLVLLGGIFLILCVTMSLATRVYNYKENILLKECAPKKFMGVVEALATKTSFRNEFKNMVTGGNYIAACISEGKYEKAKEQVEYLDKYRNRPIHRFGIAYYSGILAAMEGDHEQAQKYLDETKKILETVKISKSQRPNFEDAVTRLEACASFYKGEYEEAGKHYRESLKTVNSKFTRMRTLYYLGKCYMKTEKYVEALETYEKFYELGAGSQLKELSLAREDYELARQKAEEIKKNEAAKEQAG